jgi:ATP/maltotriose-dependent transcriptional regulator MalT
MPWSPPGHTLRGREDEIATLRSALDWAARGEYATVWVQGPPGIGKTRLLTEIGVAAHQRGFLVAKAQSDELEEARPFGLIARALGCMGSPTDPARAAIAALIVSHEQDEHGAVTVSSDPGLQYRAVDAFGDLVEQLATSRPVLLALDDLQWADSATLLTLHAIRRRSMGQPIVLIGCYRPVVDRDALIRLLDTSRDDAHTHHLMLGALPERSVHELAAEAVHAEPGPELLAQLTRAGGNALFVTELLSALTEDGSLQVQDGIARIGTVSVPSSLRVTILRRFANLPTGTTQTLRAASILGLRFAVSDLTTVTGQSVTALAAPLEQAVTAGALEDHGAELQFRHDLIHDAFYNDMPESVRTAFHREAGQRLATAGASARMVATQLDKASDPQAADWLLRAAREAAPRFPGTAVELYDRALAVVDSDTSEYRQVAVERADTLMRASSVTETIAACRTILGHQRNDPAEAGALLRLASALIVTGRPAEAAPVLNDLQEHSAATPEQQALGASEGATAQLWLGNLDRCEELACDARDSAATTPPARTGALAALSVAAGLRADFTRAIDVSDEALRQIHAGAERSAYQYPLHATRGFLLLEMDRLDQARDELNIGRRRCEDSGVWWPLPTYQAYLGTERYLRGEWDDAISELETSARLIEDTGVTFAAVLVHTTLALIRLHRNEIAAAAQSIDAANEQFTRGPQYLYHRANWADALVTQARGDQNTAYTMLAHAWNDCRTSATTLDAPLLGPDLVRANLERGEPEFARDVTVTVCRTSGDSIIRSRLAGALLCRGLVDDDPARLLDAATEYAAAGRPLDEALASQKAASTLAQRDPAHARELFTAAEHIFERLQAHRDLLRLEADMRQAGIPRGRRGPRRRPTTGWASLTETERAIADLVADGLTNPQIGGRLFVSRRTVQTHISHIFTKLDLSSRAQLATEVTGRRVHQH